MPDWLTHSLTTLKDRATQLLMKYKSGALVTQFRFFLWHLLMASFYCIYCILVPTLALEEHIQTSGYIEKVQLPTRTRVLANMRCCESHHISPIRKTALCSRCNSFSVCKILAGDGSSKCLGKSRHGRVLWFWRWSHSWNIEVWVEVNIEVDVETHIKV